MDEAAEEVMKRNLHIINLQNKIKHLEVENQNIVRFLQSTPNQFRTQQFKNYHEANHIEFSTINDHTQSVISSLHPGQHEKLLRINRMKVIRDKIVEKQNDQKCVIQDLSNCSYNINNSVL